MLDNGKVNIKRIVDNGYIIESFIYDHKKAIESYKSIDIYCQVNIDVPNTYLKSILDVFESDTFRFSDGHVHRNDEKFILDKTNGVIINYTYRDNNNKYVGKMMIHDGEKINIIRSESDLVIIEVTREGKNGKNDNLW